MARQRRMLKVAAQLMARKDQPVVVLHTAIKVVNIRAKPDIFSEISGFLLFFSR
jgi:hypothetical protein